VLALNATARSGASRIVPRLHVPTVSVSRYDVDVVVSEYGVARLAGSAGDERAQRLIAIAAPDHRDALYRQWQSMDKFGSE
jgi:acyl-CoA hydrolase